MSRDSAPALRAAQSCWMYPRAPASPPKEASVVNRSSWPPLRPVIVTDRSPPPAPRYRPNTTSSSSANRSRSEEHTSELQSPCNLVCRLLLEKQKTLSSLRFNHL